MYAKKDVESAKRTISIAYAGRTISSDELVQMIIFLAEKLPEDKLRGVVRKLVAKLQPDEQESFELST